MDTPAPTRRWLILLTVIIGTFLGRLDQTIVNLALPKIISDFKISVSAAGWIATAYILANAVFVPIWGKLGDTIGRKKVYVIGFVVFIIGSILAGFAWDLPSMIVFRVIQAIAGSADYPTAMAILAVTYPSEKERSQALGIWSSSFAVASVFGPLIGGPLIDHFSWRAVFLMNLPVGVVGLLMALAFIRESRVDRKHHAFDVAGAVVLGIALSALVLVLDKGIDWGWLSWQALVSYVIVIVSTAVFLRIERRHPEPIVDLRFFQNNIFVHALLNNFIIFMGLMGSIFLIPIFAQTFLGYDATQTGLLFIPMAVALMIAAPLGGRFTGSLQPRYIIWASTLVAGIGMYLFSFIDARSGPLDIMVPLAIMAFGMGFGMAQRTNIIAAAVPTSEVGIASSVLALARNIAGAFGIALFGTILHSSIESNVLRITSLSHFQGSGAAAYGTFIALISLKAQIDAYRTVYLLSGLLIVIGSFFILLMRSVNMKRGVHVHVE